MSWPFQPPPPRLSLAGPRVHLRPPERDDWLAWATLRARSQAFLKPWEPSWSADALGKAAFRQRIARYVQDWHDGIGYNFVICDNDKHSLLGGIGLSNVRRSVAETATLGYWMGEAHAGQHYMTEAVALVLDYAFGPLALRRMEAACLPANAPSRRLLATAGFREEGLARQYLCIDGRWQDHVLYALLGDEWRAGRPEHS